MRIIKALRLIYSTEHILLKLNKIFWVFLYAMPGLKGKIKQRLFLESSKTNSQPFIQFINNSNLIHLNIYYSNQYNT